MRNPSIVLPLATWLTAASLPVSSSGAASAGVAAPSDEIVQLDAFRVMATDARGYRAENTTSGTLVRTPIKEVTKAEPKRIAISKE